MSIAVATQPTSLVAVNDQCEHVERWAARCESIPEIQDAGHKLAAIDQYLAKTSTEGRARVAAAIRRLEVRIGELLGPAEPGGGDHGNQHSPRPSVATDGLTPDQRSDFRKLAANPDVVDDVINESTDEAPASRRKILGRIKAKSEERAVPTTIDKSQSATRGRERRLCELAQRGYTSDQIADDIGITRGAVGRIAQRLGVVVPADAVVGKRHGHDANRILSEMVYGLEAYAMSIDLIDVASIDADQLDQWATSIKKSVRSISQFLKEINP